MTDAADYRLPLLARFGVVFGWGFLRTLRSKKFLLASLLAAAFGGGLGLVTLGAPQPLLTFTEMIDNAFLGIAIPLIALALVGSGFGEEIQDQTLVYHLVRPVSRTTVFLARYASGVVPGMFVGATLVVTACLTGGTGVPLATTLEIGLLAALGVATVGALYYALAALFRRGLVAGLVYTFVVEGAFQFMSGSVRKLSLMHHVRSLYHRWTDDAFSALSVAVAEALRPKEGLMAAGMSGFAPAEEPWTTALAAIAICLGVIAAALFLGSREIARRDFALKD